MKRNVVRIDEDKCNGCGVCVPSCHEGAIRIVNGKARLTEDALCDGLGACLGECPRGAITLETREAEPYDEIAVLKHASKGPAHGCPGSMTRDFRHEPGVTRAESVPGPASSALQQWPVQLRLVDPRAPFFKGAELVVSADCVPFSYADFHHKFLKGKALVVFCPKLDEDQEEYVDKLSGIFQGNDIKTVSVVRMEVPCCGGTLRIVEEAVRRSGRPVLVREYTISLRGEII